MTRLAWITLVIAMTALTAPATAQDLAAGDRAFNKCRACHQVGPTARNGVGPKLNGLHDRTSGSVEGFNYSQANKNSGIVWNEETFGDYIKDPKAKMPGTKMVFAGIQDEQEIKNLIAFLWQFDKDGAKK